MAHHAQRSEITSSSSRNLRNVADLTVREVMQISPALPNKKAAALELLTTGGNQASLARALGIHESTLNRSLNGETSSTAAKKLCEEVAELYGLEVSELCTARLRKVIQVTPLQQD